MLAVVLGIATLWGTAAPAHADVEDFSYDSWSVGYSIGVDADGRAVVHVTETLVPRFPDFDQNRGIIRALPLRYEGAPAAPEFITVTDEHGAAVPFELEDDDGFRAILVGDDSYVHGVQHYVISYTLHDAILHTADGARDEFYWDILPLERQQDIAEFSARLVIESPLRDALQGDTACYVGAAGSDARCELQGPEDDGTTAAFTIAPVALPAGVGVTVAIGLEPGSVVQAPERLPSFMYDTLPVLFAGAAALLGVAGVVAASMLRRKRRSFRGTIVAQYEVPLELPPILAAALVDKPQLTALPAEFVHLAVQGAIRVEETTATRGKPKLQFRLLDAARAFDAIDQRALRALFGKQSVAGSEFRLPKHNQKFGEKMRKLASQGASEAEQRGYTIRERSRSAAALGTVGLLLLIPAVALLVGGSSREPGPTLFFSLLCGALAVCLGVYSVVRHRVLTPRGAEAREHLLGAAEFIRVAEADRIRMLQSYQGAERRSDGSVDVVVLYEKLLPYAMVFGLEKEWAKVLQVHYEQTDIAAPLWYPALAAHGLGHFQSAISSFTSSFTSAASYASSSSGGATGGGFSGGGGGGGFSGGR